MKPRICADFPGCNHRCRVNSDAMRTISYSRKHCELTDKIIGVFYDVYNELGHGFLESTHAEAMVVALELLGLAVFRELPVPVWFRGTQIRQCQADLVLEGTVILELKAARTKDKAHEAQLLHYLRAAEIELGRLLNLTIHPQFRRLLFDHERKKIRENPCEFVANCCGSGVC